MKTLDEKMKSIGAARRKKIEGRAAVLIAEEMTLQELRRARKITQVRVAKALGIRQEGVSRLEKRSDLLLSTLRKAVKAMGGDLRLVAAFPDREPVVLSGISDGETKPVPTGRKRSHPRRKSAERRS
jgi:transcriptional regulator with XRE-family HTH domain